MKPSQPRRKPSKAWLAHLQGVAGQVRRGVIRPERLRPYEREAVQEIFLREWLMKRGLS